MVQLALGKEEVTNQDGVVDLKKAIKIFLENLPPGEWEIEAREHDEGVVLIARRL